MRDKSSPDEAQLFAIADEHLGYFTPIQARVCGYTSPMLAYHTARGRFQHVQWGIYRFANYPYSRHEPVLVAWLGVGKDAVVSHETALYMFGLGDLIPRSIHLTVPRNRRSRRARTGVTLHTAVQPLDRHDRTTHPETGLPITTPVRTLVDIAAADTPGEEVTKAALDAIRGGLARPEELRAAAIARGPAVRKRIERALEQVANGIPAVGGAP